MGFINNSENRDQNGYIKQIGDKKKVSNLAINSQNANNIAELINLIRTGNVTLNPEQVKQAIDLAQRDIEEHSKDVSNVHFENDLDKKQAKEAIATALSEFENNSKATKEEEKELDR